MRLWKNRTNEEVFELAIQGKKRGIEEIKKRTESLSQKELQRFYKRTIQWEKDFELRFILLKEIEKRYWPDIKKHKRIKEILLYNKYQDFSSDMSYIKDYLIIRSLPNYGNMFGGIDLEKLIRSRYIRNHSIKTNDYREYVSIKNNTYYLKRKIKEFLVKKYHEKFFDIKYSVYLSGTAKRDSFEFFYELTLGKTKVEFVRTTNKTPNKKYWTDKYFHKITLNPFEKDLSFDSKFSFKWRKRDNLWSIAERLIAEIDNCEIYKATWLEKLPRCQNRIQSRTGYIAKLHDCDLCFYFHADTMEEALRGAKRKQKLYYKSLEQKEEKKYSPNHLITRRIFKNITGACAFGIKEFCTSNSLNDKKSLPMKDLILLLEKTEQNYYADLLKERMLS